MADFRRTTTSLVALGAFALLAPLATPTPALADSAWLEQDLSSADRIGLALDAGGLRLNPGDRTQLGASPRLDPSQRHAGLATFPEQELGEATDTIDVAVRVSGDAEEVLTEARGVRADGMWTEWHPTGPGGGRVTLPEAVSEVQLRIGVESALGSASRVRADRTSVTDVRVRAVEGTGTPPSPEPEAGETQGSDEDSGEEARGDDVPRPFSARLFATRIGLVGNTTANGHKVRTADQFAALPSRRGLSNRGGGEYTVRVCSTGALGPEASGDTRNHVPRCAYLPVWDVGPWNITDDHWNADRESWRDLDRGRPQAQAAYTENHNNGLDGFGRKVLNPAGIDLADGAFNEGLQLPTNGWVRVDYLWTAQYRARAEITTASGTDPVIVREGPGTEFDTAGLAAHKANVDVACRTTGDRATGPTGTSDVWYRIGEGHYVPAAFAVGGADAPRCARS
ncbi:hypothetical protein [Nocardiopsis sp. L17-MgMaSL7]|uniref:hypothetical protein n=1 Tax=Nocardiopsis sp. L17-MgMaSL7 TaxID=1938893 RepID=UPI000D7163EE|nr:hypothetical protein [Nocardiopsis sp. L17-MgMaSL7]PWV52986.1 hypothetical protein BDW27_105332 [Nocardiopsis sp. L17-MgMaSL7]